MATVLLAEDEPALLDAFQEIVLALGHECVAVRDGNDALALARQRPPDLVLVDFMMPGRSGGDVIRAMRAEPRLAHVPVILMSAGRPPEAERALATRFLAKPLSLADLEAAIGDLLAKGAQAPPRAASALAEPAEPVSPLSLAREQMLSWVAHELKSPLAAALMAAHLGLRGARGGEEVVELEKRLAVIVRQLSRMDELINSILDAAQLQDGRLRLERERFAAGPWVQGVVGFWRELYPDWELVVDDGAGAIIEADRERLRQVLDNLLSNAIKYGGPSRRVQVVVQASEGEVRISVADQGPGIAREELPHIFDRFHRVAGQGGRGHGLGLYIAASLVRLHGGTLSVVSELGQGSTFTVALPRRAQPPSWAAGA